MAAVDDCPAQRTNASMLAWHIAITEPQRETSAALEIASNLHLTVFNPRCAQRIVRRGIASEVFQPVFPGYLMVQFDMTDKAYPWQEIYRTKGIRRRNGQAFLTGAGRTPLALADIAVTALMAMCPDGIMRDVEAAMGTLLRIGQRVRVLSGPFADHVGEVVWVVGERIKVLLAFLGGVDVELRGDQLEAVA